MSKELSDLVVQVMNCGGPGSGVPGPCPMGGLKGAGTKVVKGFTPIAAPIAPTSASGKAALKAMPAGTKNGEWSKRGGHAGKNTIIKTVEKMKKLGFVEASSGVIGGAGSEHFGSVKTLRHPDGHSFNYSSSYGVTADSNRFRMGLKLSTTPTQ